MTIINSVGTRTFIRNFRDKATQVALNCLGGKDKQFVITGEKTKQAINWIGKNISSPENRLILGATALMTQPFIDASNKNIDSETKRYSVCRTIAKILVGTVTGYFIRKGCIKTIDAFTKLPNEIKPHMKFKKLRSILLPTIKHTAEELSQYKNALGTLMALGVMVFTNFLIDAPATKWLTNVFAGKSKPDKGVDNGKSC